MTYNKGLLKEIQYVKGVGPARAALFNKLGIKNIANLLYYFPREWVDRTDVRTINKVVLGEKQTVKGVVTAMETRKVRGNLKITSVLIRDESGYITGVWYNQPYMEKIFKKGDMVMFYGKVEMFRGAFQIPTPEYEVLNRVKPEGTSGNLEEQDLLNMNRIVPIYPLTDKITQKQFRKIVKYAVDNYGGMIEDGLPISVIKKYSLMPAKDAVLNAHFPESREKLDAAKKRIIFEEFFYLQYALLSRKQGIKLEKAPVLTAGKVFNKVLENLPFMLTRAQQNVLEEILSDLKSGKSMNRLVQGDVGSGKTVVALLASLAAIDSGYQAAIMAPTELLASQHLRTMAAFLEGTGIRAELLLGATGAKKRAQILQSLAEGAINLIIGTHSLLVGDIKFKKLGFIVIDEQHRFGVMQRAALAEKAGERPHTLVMTATPIPRTLSLTVYGDTDISIIDALPPGRKPVRTLLFADNQKRELFAFIEERLKEGEQVYAVYPLVDESEKMDLKSAVEMHGQWQERFAGYKIALVHGRMKKEERDAAMDAFKRREIQVLVATTVIEVGVDVPNASVMVIEHAERFGLSQLHQLRGRVGRGSAQSYCILVGDPRTEEGFKRLGIMTSTWDGFKISEEDLALRGPGEFMGTRQHGLPEFKMGNIVRDRKAMEESRQAADELISGKCDISHSEKEQLSRILKQNYGADFRLINIS